MNYQDFLTSKIAVDKGMGFEVAGISSVLKPHQRDIVTWAVRGGRRAIFAAFGLGKSLIQIEIMRLIQQREGLRQLIVCPLGVRQEFKRDAQDLLGIETRFVRRSDDVVEPGLYITNYESVRDGRLDVNLFNAVSLDEASVLRSYGSKTYQEFLTLFSGVKYRFVATATPSPNRHKELIHYAGFLGIMDTGQALAQPLDAKVLTPAGWKTMGDILPGDQVISVDGTPTNVIGVYPQGEKAIFKVSFSDGSSTECTEDHLWLTRTQYERNNEARYAKRNGLGADRCGRFATVKTTEEIASTLACSSTGSANYQIPMVNPVWFEHRDTSINPYLMGILLGDGHIRRTSVSFTSIDDYIVDTVRDIVESDYGLAANRVEETRKDGRTCYDYAISNGSGKGSGGGRGHFTNGLLNALRSYDLLEKRAWNKRVPEDYLFNSMSVRMEVLRGLMDSDGTIDNVNRTISFVTTSPGLAEDVQFLVRSMGGVAEIRKRTPHKCNADIAGRSVQGWREQYKVSINMPPYLNPFRIPRKADLVVPKVKYFPTRYITAVEPVGMKPAQCIAVDHPDHLYVTDDFIVTHNTRFFQRDSTKANNLTLYPHKEKEFYLWLHSWAVFLQRPSDLGYSDDGYELPPIQVHYHRIKTDVSFRANRDGQYRIFNDASVGVQDASAEKRRSVGARVEKMMEIIGNDPENHYILWHDQEDERRAIKKALPEAVEVFGSLDLDEREQRIIDFTAGKFRYLATKPILSGSGCNFQYHCHKAIYVGIGFKFNDFVQSIHRIHRFLQSKPVEIHIIHTDTEDSVLRILKEKWQQHEKTVNIMSEIIRKHGLNVLDMASELGRSIGCERIEVTGKHFTAVNNDCVDETRRMETNSVGLIHTSIPFSNHYEYSPSYNDFGHNANNEEFFRQMDFLTPELLRVLKPGRVAAIHVKDRVLFGNVTGYGMPSMDPFHVDCVQHYRRHGFIYFGMITVVTDVVRENNQTYRLGWTEQCKDGSKMGVGCPEYILLFRKLPTDTSRAYADEPVVKSKEKYSRAQWQTDAHAFWRSSGDRLLSGDEITRYPVDVIGKIFERWTLESIYDYESHVKIGEHLDLKGVLPSTFMLLAPASQHPDVWHDVNRMLTLNGKQRKRNLTMHICPLQEDIVTRIINRYSNQGDVVYDPFGGLMTVPYHAVKMGRYGIGCELNPESFRDGCSYLNAADNAVKAPTLFDFEREQIKVAA